MRTLARPLHSGATRLCTPPSTCIHRFSASSLSSSPSPPTSIHSSLPNSHDLKLNGHAHANGHANGATGANGVNGNQERTRKNEKQINGIISFIANLEQGHDYSNSIDIMELFKVDGVTTRLADRIMRQGKRYNQVGVKEYGAYIKCVGMQGDLQRVLKAMQEMSAAGLLPDASALNGLMHAFRVTGSADVMLRLARTRIHEWPLESRADPFGIIVQHYVHKGEVEKAEAIVNEAEELGITLDASLVNPLLEHYVLVVAGGKGNFNLRHDRNAREQTAEETAAIEGFNSLVRRMKLRSGKLDEYTYNYRIQMHLHLLDLNAAMEVLKNAAEKGDKLLTYTFNLLVSAVVEAENQSTLVELVTAMPKVWVTPDSATYTRLANAFVHWNNLLGLQGLAKVIVNSVDANDWVFTLLIKSLYQLNDFETGDQLLQHMQQVGISPTKYTFNAILHRYSLSENKEMCDKVYEQMQAARVVADGTTYDIMLNAYYSLGYVDKYKATLDQALVNTRPRNSWFYKLGLLYMDKHDYQAVIDNAKRALQVNGTETKFMLSLEVRAHSFLGNVDEMNAVYERLLPHLTKTQKMVMSAYVHANLAAGRDVCLKCLAEATKYKVNLPDTTLDLMTDFLKKENKLEELREVEKYAEKKAARKDEEERTRSRGSNRTEEPEDLEEDTEIPTKPKTTKNIKYNNRQNGHFKAKTVRQDNLPTRQTSTNFSPPNATQVPQPPPFQPPSPPQPSQILSPQESPYLSTQPTTLPPPLIPPFYSQQSALPDTLSVLQQHSLHARLLSTSYNLLLHDASARGDLVQCGHLLFFMAHAGVRVDANAYEGLLAAALSRANESLVQHVLSDMQMNGYAMTVHIYNLMLACWAERGDKEKCEKLLKQMNDTGVFPDDTTRKLMAQLEVSNQV